jgi:aspartyl protease family protein
MGTPDDGRPSGKREAPNPAIPPSSSPDAFPGSRITITRRGPSSFARIVAFGSWLAVFMLLVALLKGTNEWRLHRLKEQVKAMQPRPAASVTAQTPEPETAPTKEAPPAEPAPVAARVSPAAPPPSLDAPPAEEPPENPAAQLAEVTLSPSPNGNFYVKGQINQQEVTFVIDTGASAVSIPDKLRWKLGLTRGRYLQSATANGVAGMYETQVKRLSVGPLRFKDVQAVLYPNAPDDTVLLGMTALREVRMVQQNGRMVLQQVVHPENDAAAAPKSPPPALKKSISQCMGADKVVNDRVLKCMQGMGE